MTAFPPPGKYQDLSGLIRLDGSVGSHPIMGAGEWAFGAAAGWYNLMHAAARVDGVNLTAVSGHRTNAEQAYLRSEYLAGRGNLAAPAGSSRHEYGQAVDIHTNNCTDMEVINWLDANAWRFRFVATIRSIECWHWVYQGQMDDLVPEEAPMYPLPVVPPSVHRGSKANKMAAQSILVYVFGEDLGTSGPGNDGVDGDWGAKTIGAQHRVQERLGLGVGSWGPLTNGAIQNFMSDMPSPEPDLGARVAELEAELLEVTLTLAGKDQALEQLKTKMAAARTANAALTTALS